MTPRNTRWQETLRLLDSLLAPLPKPRWKSCPRCGHTIRGESKKCSSCRNMDAGAVALPEEDTPCFERKYEWAALEQEVDQALEELHGANIAKKRVKLYGAFLARKQFCDDCLFVKGCHTWAGAEGYTGLAAGEWFAEGRPITPLPPPQSSPTQRKARKARKDRERLNRLRRDPVWVAKDRARRRASRQKERVAQ